MELSGAGGGRDAWRITLGVVPENEPATASSQHTGIPLGHVAHTVVSDTTDTGDTLGDGLTDTDGLGLGDGHPQQLPTANLNPENAMSNHNSLTPRSTCWIADAE